MTTRQLERLGRYWQRKLRLQDWRISIAFAEQDDMHSSDNVGECYAQLCDRTAHIKIVKDGQTDYELELAICHELLHVLYVDMGPNNPVKRKLFESAIDQTASTLLYFKRGLP